jgi:hypothetical protein
MFSAQYTLPQYSLGFIEKFSNPYCLLCSALVENIGDEEVAFIGVGVKLGYGRVTGNLGHTLGPPCGS